MKKLIVLVAAVALSGAMTSCKKDYVCKCNKTFTHSNGSTHTDPDGSYTFKDSKARAADRCNQQEGSGTDAIEGTYTRDCEIQ